MSRTELIVLILGLVIMAVVLFSVGFSIERNTDRLLDDGKTTLEKAEKINRETKRLLEEGCK